MFTNGDGRVAGKCRANLQEFFQRAVVNCAVKSSSDVTSPPVLPFFLQQGMIGEGQAAPSLDSAADKMCSSPQPATVPAPAVSFSYATMAARPSTPSAASGADKTIGAAAAHIPESDVSKVNLFDSFARAIANRPVPGPVESPPVRKCLPAPPITDFSSILLYNVWQRSTPLPPCEAVETALFRMPEAVVQGRRPPVKGASNRTRTGPRGQERGCADCASISCSSRPAGWYAGRDAVFVRGNQRSSPATYGRTVQRAGKQRCYRRIRYDCPRTRVDISRDKS